jgi:hypothetical protein
VLAEAAAELGFLVRVFGLTKKPGFILYHGHSPTLKYLLLQEAVEFELSIGRMDENALMVFVDGHDVFLQQPATTLLAAYNELAVENGVKDPVVLSGERNCWPWPHSDASHGEWDPQMVGWNRSWYLSRWFAVNGSDWCRMAVQDGPYPFLNIGSVMGPVGKLLRVLKRNNELVLAEDLNDQGAMWLVLARHGREMGIIIDQWARVFMNLLSSFGDMERPPCAPGWFAGTRADPRAPRNVRWLQIFK